MGRIMVPLGSDDELDRPDLNKCPDCMCFFAGDNCPLCGKSCPEEMRAGNRKPVKKKKHRENSSGRVTFVDWYHTWWFIILMLFFSPVIGIILLATSPHKRSHKITFIVIAALYAFLSTFGFIIFGQISNLWEKPIVDTSLKEEEYISACQTVTPEKFYREAGSFTDQKIRVTLTVKERVIDAYDSDGYNVYYVCNNGQDSNFEILIRDCIQNGEQNFVAGDVITVYGEGAGSSTIYSGEGFPVIAPCINVAYVE